MPPKMQVEVARLLLRLKANQNLAVYQLGFLKFFKMKIFESC